MVRVALYRDAAGRACGYSTAGHAGQGPAGEDMVCAAVSALVQTAALGLERHLGLAVQVREGPGHFDCLLPRELGPSLGARAADVLETMWLGLREIQAAHPDAVRLCEQARQPKG